MIKLIRTYVSMFCRLAEAIKSEPILSDCPGPSGNAQIKVEIKTEPKEESS